MGSSTAPAYDKSKADFSGYATKAGLKCADGRTIESNAFQHQDNTKVPLVWQHSHGAPMHVLGHAYLENVEDGVVAHGYFNDTEAGRSAKELVRHGDITQLSIYANKLVDRAKTVLHGAIKEVSLVLSGANPGALIDPISVQHADGEFEELDDAAIIYTGLALQHSEPEPEQEPEPAEEPAEEPEATVAQGEEEEEPESEAEIGRAHV